MSLAETFLAEFQQEVETTRKFLQNLPADKLDWQPHEKSLTAGQLALHVARVPGEVLEMGLRSHITMADLNPSSGYRPTSFQEIMDELDESEAKVKELLPTITDAQMQETWSLQVDGNPIFELPRAALLRSIMFNHWYHHRGQFGVYLRLLGAKVPSSYGPSGDEMPEFLQGVEMSMS